MLKLAALALNIAIGGSVGNVSANNFVTVQDTSLTNQVCVYLTARLSHAEQSPVPIRLRACQ